MGRAQTAEYGEATAEILAEVESTAVTIRAWNGMVLPGLLQTERYAYAAIRLACPSLPPEELVRRVSRRMDRIQSFRMRWEMENDRVGRAWFIVGESAITRPVQNTALDHSYVLGHLLNISRSWPNMVIQVLPDVQPTPGRTGQFSLYSLEGRTDGLGKRLPGPRMGYLETLIGGWYTTRTEDVARLHSAFSDMVGAALPPDESRRFIQREQQACWGRTTEQSSSSPATPTPGTASRSPGHAPSE